MSEASEREQAKLKDMVPEAEAFLSTQTDQSDNLQRFIERVKSMTEPKELTAELVHKYIEKIVVYAPKQIDGKRVQLLDIYFNGVGIVQPMTPEEMEEAFQKRLKTKRRNR